MYRHTDIAPFTTCSVTPMPTRIYSKLTVARPIAFHPCVIKLGVVEVSALAKPSPATTTTTGFAGFVGDTLGTSSAEQVRSRSTAGRGDVGFAL